MSSFATKCAILLAVIAVFITALALLLNSQDMLQTGYAFLRSDIHAWLFILFMAFLPVFAIPFSPFLVLSGIKFGSLLGCLLTLLIMPVHLVLCYAISKGLGHQLILRIARYRGYNPPPFLTNQPGKLVFLFLIMPGPPYILKNYLLALTGLRFAPYLGLTWLAQAILALPVVVLGGSAAQQRWGLFISILVLFLLGSAGLHWYKMSKARD